MLANFSNLITFSRGSNATVTDASGRLTYAPHNLVTNSQDFESANWTKNNVSVTANSTAAPDGTTTADFVVPNTTGGVAHNIYASVTVAAVPYVLSIYAKSGGYSAVKVGNLFTGVGASFNLATGTVHSTDAGITASITAAGNGWYRCAVAFVASAGSTLYGAYVQSPVGTNSFAGDGTSGVYLWGAQLEAVTYQTTPSPYVSTSVANLLGFSEDFTNAAWTKQRASIVPNAAQNPINGLWTAQKLMEDTTASNTHRVLSALITMPSGILSTVSVYMKAAERTWGYITDAGVTNSGAYVNLATGEFGTIAGGVTRSSIQSVGNGWYRVSISGYLAGTLSQLFVSVATSNGNFSYTGDGNSGIYIYGAQLSNSGSLDPYVPTPGAAPSSTAYYGPRFDYDPVTLAAKGILIEEQRTNLLTYSEQFDNGSVWVLDNGGAVNPVVTANQGIAPDGTNTADRIILNKTGGVYSRIQQQTVLASAVYTFSVWMKTTSGTGTANVGLRIDLQAINCAVTGVWQRFSVTLPSAVANPACQILLFDSIAGNDETADILVYGAQMEAGAFATSYIPTVASQVTRSADVASITGSLFSQWFNPDQGAIVFEGSIANRAGVPVLTGYRTPGTASFLFIDNANVGAWNGSVSVTQTGGSITNGVTFRAAMAYSPTGRAVTSGGGAPASDSNTIGAAALLSLGMPGSGPGGGQVLNGHIRNITYYPTRLTNDQLQAITK